MNSILSWLKIQACKKRSPRRNPRPKLTKRDFPDEGGGVTKLCGDLAAGFFKPPPVGTPPLAEAGAGCSTKPEPVADFS